MIVVTVDTSLTKINSRLIKNINSTRRKRKSITKERNYYCKVKMMKMRIIKLMMMQTRHSILRKINNKESRKSSGTALRKKMMKSMKNHRLPQERPL